ncbi:hypothetical protein EON65_56000 [archaeon]|nr:MAG: hypothetical protein EON65_56000 [archaeon]
MISPYLFGIFIMDLSGYDENAALERALKASMENPVFSLDPTKREEEELAFALKLSQQEQTSYQGSEEDAVKAAIALSMNDAANMKAVQELEAQKVNKDMQIEEIPLPAHLVPNFKKLVFNFEMELGIKIYVVFDGATCYKIRVVGYDSDVMAIAKITLEGVVQDPIQLEAKLDSLKSQRVHVFIDYSNIFIGM